MTGYSTHEVAEATGASYRQLDYWARTGLVRPSVDARGSGTYRRYSFTDVVLCRLVVLLAVQGRLPRGCGVGGLVSEALVSEALDSADTGWYLGLPGDGGPIVTREPAAVIAEHHDIVTLVDLDTVSRHVTAALRPAVASTPAYRPRPADVAGVDGAAGPGLSGKSVTRTGRTITNEEGAVGISHDALSIA